MDRVCGIARDVSAKADRPRLGRPRKGRTIQLATRVSPEIDARLRALAKRDEVSLVEVLERALAAYDPRPRR